MSQRNTDDQTAIIGQDLAINEVHQAAITATEKSQMNDDTRREYRNRLSHIYKWWQNEYPDYYENETRELTTDKRADTVMYH